MSFFPAIVPKGTLLYHGDCTPERPEVHEWLAFEIPHAEMFAKVRGSECRHINKGELKSKETFGLLGQEGYNEHRRRPPWELKPGWLQIYQANRDLKLLYIDGMSAANCHLGTIDTQDLLLLNFTGGIWDERGRSRGLCDLAAKWGLDGVIRMEAGFEIIKCDFSTGLDFLSHRRRPPMDHPAMVGGFHPFEYIREVSQRYNGIDSSRVLLDYSAMVSSYFYPLNLSNPDCNSSLPRLPGSELHHLQHIKSDLGEHFTKPKPHSSIDWQGVVDMIVKRYSDRLQYMATNLPQKIFLSELNILLNLYVEYESFPILSEDPITTCALHYLRPVTPSTDQDWLIFAALKTVTHRICETLFAARDILIEKEKQSTQDAPLSAVDLVQELIEWLDWTEWKACGPCGYDKVCFVAVFPIGTPEDHFHPSCRNRTEMERRDSWERNYWMKPEDFQARFLMD